MYKGFIKVSLTVLLVLVFAGIPQAQPVPDGLVFWNGLGSQYEVYNSHVGPGLEYYTGYVQGDRDYVPGVVGNCVTLAGTGYSSMDRIHNLVLNNVASVLDTEKGTIECWYYQTDNPVAYSHGVYRMFDGAFGLYSGMSFATYNPYSIYPARLGLGLNFGGPACYAGFDMAAIPNNTWVHIAGCWDRNGIDGTSDSIRVYMNNQLMAAITKNDWGTTYGARADICGGNDQNIVGKFKMDELKIWNYAKTNFDDSDVAEDYSVIAGNSVKIGTGCTVESGHVVVTHQTPGPYLSSLGQLVVRDYVHGHDNVQFKADSVDIAYGTTVYDVFYNTIDNDGTIRHDAVHPLTLPLDVTPPTPPAVTAGTQNVTVPAYQQLVLQPGNYGDVKVYNGANLIFAGGTYHLNKLYIPGDYCGIYFRAPSEVNIATRMITDVGMTMGPESAGLDIKDIRINVHYASPAPTSTEAVRFGPYAMVRAVVHAPNGTIKIKDGCTVEGTMMGKDVFIWSYVLLRLGY